MSERSSKDKDNRTRRQLSLQSVSRLLLNKTVEEWSTGNLLLAACRASQTDSTNEALDRVLRPHTGVLDKRKYAAVQ